MAALAAAPAAAAHPAAHPDDAAPSTSRPHLPAPAAPHAAPSPAGSLSAAYDAAVAAHRALTAGAGAGDQPAVAACAALFAQCAARIRADATFSSNETLRDLSTRRLSYLLVPFRRAELQDLVRVDMSDGPGPRLALLRQADVYLEVFLQRCVAYGIAEGPEAERFAAYLESNRGRDDGDEDDDDDGGGGGGGGGGGNTRSAGPRRQRVGGPSAAAPGGARASAETHRELKIQSFQRQKLAKQRIDEILRIRERRKRRQRGGRRQGPTGGGAGREEEEPVEEDEGDDDAHELERELMLLLVQSAVRDALDALDSHQRELPMLAHMAKMMGGRSGASARDAADPRTKARREAARQRASREAYANRPGLSLTHIGPDGSVTREQLKAQVFRPGHRAPTMSLEELAEIEVADAKARKARQDAAEADPNRPGMKIKQLEEAGKEDDMALVDKATERDRQWDDWKDMNPKGSGVTKRI